MKKVISMISALAMIVSMFTAVATTSYAAASEDSKPTITGKVVDVDADGYAIMQFSLNNNEELSYTSSRGKVTSNGINAIQVGLNLDENVFDVSESYITSNLTGALTSGDNTGKFTFAFAQSSPDAYLTSVPAYIIQIDALLKDGYTIDNIPSSAITFGACKVEYTSYAGVALSAGATTYTIYAANTDATHDYSMAVSFTGTATEGETYGTPIETGDYAGKTLYFDDKTLIFVFGTHEGILIKKGSEEKKFGLKYFEDLGVSGEAGSEMTFTAGVIDASGAAKGTYEFSLIEKTK